MSHQETMTKYIAAFVAELVNTGVRDVVISPGSRSTPLAMVMAKHPELHLHIYVDERSAAFFALGMAKASGNPTAIVCTSGTAAANYYPAIIEAYYGRVPLIVLTADRPHELRDIGAPQAIDQIHLYGKHVKWFVEMAPPEDSEEMLRYIRTVCSRAAAIAKKKPSGPVHLNFPLREPLVPDIERKDLFLPSEKRQNRYVDVSQNATCLVEEEVRIICDMIGKSKRGIIICGAIEEPGFQRAVIKLAEKIQFPILADPLSQLRSGTFEGTNIIDTYDTFLRNEDAKRVLKPEMIIRFGAMPVSKSLLFFIKESKEAIQLVVDSGNGWRDPTLMANSMIYCSETSFCEQIAEFMEERSQSDYLEKWRQINERTKNGLARIQEVPGLSEGKIFYELSRLLPNKSTLFVGNSMPIRDLDTFFHYNQKSVRIMANRGVNGIDGTVSTALGVSVFHQPCFLIVGDLTFFHDLNGLMLAKLYRLNINIIVINNNGGGIFSFLPQSDYPETFEQLFGTPLDLQFGKAVEMYQGTYELIQEWEQFVSSFKKNILNSGLKVFEVVTNREKNLREHRVLWNSVSQEISRFLHGEGYETFN